MSGKSQRILRGCWKAVYVTGMAKKSATQEEVQFRIGQVAERISRGDPRKEITSWILNESGWGIGENQAYNYIARAWELIRELGAVNLQQQFGKALFDLQSLYKEALKQNDLDLALKVRKELSDTLGLKKQTIRFETGDNGESEEFSVVNALISRLTIQRQIEDREIRKNGRSLMDQETGKKETA